MRTSTVKTAWATFTESVTDDNDIIRCLRHHPERLDAMGGMDEPALSAKMENEWRTFLERTKRVEQKTGYIKRCANALALKIADEEGPATMLALLLSEFKVDANIKDTRGTYIFDTALRTGVTSNAMALLVGCGKNKVKGLEKDAKWAKSTILDTVSLPAKRYFDPISGVHVNSTAFLLKNLLDAGTSLYETEDDGTPVHSESPTDYEGWNVWCHAAYTGNMEVMALLLAHSAEHKVHVDMNTTHMCGHDMRWNYGDRSITPLLLVSRIGAFTEAGVSCAPCARGCFCTNCNMPIIKMLLANGANPHITALHHELNPFTAVYSNPVRTDLSLCPDGRAQMGMAMYERVQSSRAMVIWAMQGRLPKDLVAFICTCAGIGAKMVVDAETPWIPTMPARTTVETSRWFGYYRMIDERIEEMRVLRSS